VELKMAKLNSDTIEIKVSELIKDDESAKDILDAEVVAQLVEIIEQLVGDKRLVEVNIK
jgi:hypothetical protein